MKTYLECLPCFARQALEAVTLATDDDGVRESVMREVLRLASELDMHLTPPHMGHVIHELVRKGSGVSDPYKSLKSASNKYALKIMPRLRETISQSEDRLQRIVAFVIAANMIDFGIRATADFDGYEKEFRIAETTTIDQNELSIFREAVQRAGKVAYLADNAGEIVVDRLLIEYIGPQKIILAVKDGPILNDATLVDAHEAGFVGEVKILSNGSQSPGTILEYCSNEFRETLHAVDLVIAKGQANYETLSDTSLPVSFLLKVKCPIIARDIRADVGDYVLRNNTCLKFRYAGGQEGERITTGGM